MARPGMSRLSRETLAIIGATIAPAALILTGTAGVCGEIQAIRDALRAEPGSRSGASFRWVRSLPESKPLRPTKQHGVLGTRLGRLGSRASPRPFMRCAFQ